MTVGIHRARANASERVVSQRPPMSLRWLNQRAVPLVGVCLIFVCGIASAAVHVVDGAFGPLEWTVSATDGTLARPTEASSGFIVAGVSNGARLYAEGSNNGTPTSGSLGNKLELLYDCAVCVSPLPANAALDIFFNSGPDDYAVHVFSALGVLTFNAFEKPVGTPSLLHPDGSLDLSGPVWTPLTPLDLLFAQFVVAVGFGATPNSGIAHYFAEFELSVNTAPPGAPGGPNGLYSPDPAFWGASTSGSGGFPTGSISSGQFTLNPDGSVTVIPIVGSDGRPLIQPVPEPQSLPLALVALWAMAATRSTLRRRSSQRR